MPGLLPLTFAGSRLLVGALMLLCPSLSATLLLLPHPPATIPLIRCCGAREFVIGGLLYAAIRPDLSPFPSSTSVSRHPADLKMVRIALIAGVAVDFFDLLVMTWSWAVESGTLTGGPAGVITACAGTNLLVGLACLRALPRMGAKS